MKPIIIILLMLGLILNVRADADHFVLNIKVVDNDTLKPVENAKVVVSFSPGGKLGGASINKEGATDANGSVVIEGDSIFEMRVGAKKEGWYWSGLTAPNHVPDAKGKYYPKSKQDIILKIRKIKNPIPMYAKRIELISPENGKKIGYDFKVGDWVTPHGKGKTADMFILSELSQRGPRDFDHTILISFPNEHDGIKEIFYDTLSEFKSDYLAPEQGYQASWKYIRSRRPDEGEKGNVNRNRNYLLRVRTNADKSGKIESANYVKIYGEIPRFSYYFNPTPNDRNLEFDPAKNLFDEILRDELVTDP
ncbi:MAG: hypothetical protein HC904_12685 [Blastochloris sp.]|nr:hypothetical protein [Blastochloris sp.]